MYTLYGVGTQRPFATTFFPGAQPCLQHYCLLTLVVGPTDSSPGCCSHIVSNHSSTSKPSISDCFLFGTFCARCPSDAVLLLLYHVEDRLAAPISFNRRSDCPNSLPPQVVVAAFRVRVRLAFCSSALVGQRVCSSRPNPSRCPCSRRCLTFGRRSEVRRAFRP